MCVCVCGFFRGLFNVAAVRVDVKIYLSMSGLGSRARCLQARRKKKKAESLRQKRSSVAGRRRSTAQRERSLRTARNSSKLIWLSLLRSSFCIISRSLYPGTSWPALLRSSWSSSLQMWLSLSRSADTQTCQLNTRAHAREEG